MRPHPDITRWADYVRGLADAGERAALRRHLDAGCDSCATRVAALERVAAVAAAELKLTPPPSALRPVLALAELARPDRRSRLDALSLALRGDTALSGVAGGIRSGEPAAGRQVLFATGRWALDLSIEPAAEPPGSLELTGSWLEQQGRPLAGVALLAVAEDRVVDHARTGEMGEFQLTGVPPEPLELWLVAGAGRPLVAELDLSA